MVRLNILISGTKFWHLNNKWHRANGPAIAYYDGEKSWYWHDSEVTEYEHMMLVGQEMANG
jgi:hypothetical protein